MPIQCSFVERGRYACLRNLPTIVCGLIANGAKVLDTQATPIAAPAAVSSTARRCSFDPLS